MMQACKNMKKAHWYSIFKKAISLLYNREQELALTKAPLLCFFLSSASGELKQTPYSPSFFAKENT